jgi:hypothetical protein
VVLEGFEAVSGASPQTVAQRILQLLYTNAIPKKPQKKDENTRDVRDKEIRCRYKGGERVTDLAQEFGMTIQGIYRILPRS